MPKSILVADDEKSMLSVYTRLFTVTDYSISTASSFTEAAGLINSTSYDLLITDLTFPDGLGTELIKLFKKRRKGARSLLVTGSDPQYIPRQFRNIRLEKPFKMEVLLKAVAEALDSQPRARRRPPPRQNVAPPARRADRGRRNSRSSPDRSYWPIPDSQ